MGDPALRQVGCQPIHASACSEGHTNHIRGHVFRRPHGMAPIIAIHYPPRLSMLLKLLRHTFLELFVRGIHPIIPFLPPDPIQADDWDV